MQVTAKIAHPAQIAIYSRSLHVKMVSASVKRTSFGKMSDVVIWITVNLTVTVVVSENVPLSTNVNFLSG